MLERILVALAVISAGVIAYQLLLWGQRRRAGQEAGHGPRLGRSTLLVFTSPTCGPCKLQQLPIIERLMIDWRDKIDLRLIDVTEQPEVASQFGVWSLPTTIVLATDRQVAAINQGVASERKLREQFERVAVLP